MVGPGTSSPMLSPTLPVSLLHGFVGSLDIGPWLVLLGEGTMYLLRRGIRQESGWL